ncbi:mannosyltransferase [Naganishia albida]|nr:mannosyltransferase [Naganishia albida]
MQLRPGTETIRFRRPTAGPNAQQQGGTDVDKFGGKHGPDVKGWKRRHMGLLQDLVGRQRNGPFLPGFSFAVRLLLLVRVGAAMYANIQDCDEVFNFFEPLHYFQYNAGFQTWELSPEYAVRSWAYILLHWPFAHIIPSLMSLPKRASFFCLRIGLGIICSICEAKFYRGVVENVNERVGRYTLAMMILSAGMWNAGVSFLPSSFAMNLTMLAYSYYLEPSTTNIRGDRRVTMATISFAIGAILGWPFAALLALPFVVEEMLVKSGDEVVGEEIVFNWRVERIARLIKAVVCAAALAIPVIAFDSWAYGKPTFPTLNIVLYNLFSGKGPELYGTEPPTFYLANLFLNFNFALPLALLSLPALAITYRFDFKRLGVSQVKPKPGQSSPYTLVALRLSGFYLWLIVMSAQAHKEERFMYPVYPLLCMNAAVTVFLIKGWAETAFVKATASPYRASQTRFFSYLALSMVLPTMILGVSRVYALGHFYRSPYDVIYHFQYEEVPKLLRAAGHEPIPPPEEYREGRAKDGYSDEWDYTVLAQFEPKLRLCYGKEWHRFLGSYLVPEGIEINWIRTEFDGAMPRRWEPSHARAGSWWPRQETRVIREGKFNDDNKESVLAGTYVNAADCTYLIDSALPSQPPTSAEPAYTTSDEWERLYCTPFLDNAGSKWWARIFYLPGQSANEARQWGEYCLLKRK